MAVKQFKAEWLFLEKSTKLHTVTGLFWAASLFIGGIFGWLLFLGIPAVAPANLFNSLILGVLTFLSLGLLSQAIVTLCVKEE